MKCKNHKLKNSGWAHPGLIAWLGLLTSLSACRTEPVRSAAPDRTGVRTNGDVRSAAPALPLDRIAIVGASVSAGFGGTPFGDAFTAAAPRSKVESSANVMLFKDPPADTRRQLADATAFKPTVVFALDLLFWDVYGSGSPAELADALAGLDRLHAAGAWIVVGDIPLITTAAEWMLPKDAIPSQPALDAANATIRSWVAEHDHAVLVPLADWTAPLRAGQAVTLPSGESVQAAELVSIDGLHANPLGDWYLLSKLDAFLEMKFPGTPKDALVFVRPQ